MLEIAPVVSRNLALALLLAALPASPVWAESRQQTPHVLAELIAEDTALTPGATHWLGLRLTPDPEWHVYWRNPGDSGLPTQIEWSLPEGYEAGPIHWPYPAPKALGDLVNYGYEGPTLHLVPLTTPPDASGPVRLEAQARWLVCKDVCIPGSAQLALELPVAETSAPDPAVAAAFAEARARLPQPWPEAEARIAVADGTVSWQFAAIGPAGATLRLFPVQNDLVDHAAPQRIAREGEVIRISQALSPYHTALETPAEAVLVVEAGGATTAYTLYAEPGAVAAVAPVSEAAPRSEPAAVGPSFALVLVLAFAGGLILNLMPCVFPVLSLKAMAVMRAREESAAHRRQHALLYTAGVVASCLVVAAALLLLRAGGEAIGWGFQLQSPVFVGLMAYLMFLLGLSLSGMLHLGTGLMGLGQSLTQGQSASSSFFTGVLAVVVASPCTAPFMGTALGFALTQPAAVSLTVFAALGLGLASPFLLIGFLPGAARLLPRPGAWMETFKQFMAFPLYLTAVWLVWVAGRQAGPNAMAVLLLGLVAIAFAVWLLGRPGRLRRALALAAALLALALLGRPALQSPAPGVAASHEGELAQAYSDALFERLRAEGQTVFVNFTADWCLSCKVNERVALKTERVQQAFAARGVHYLVGDWTRADPAITAVLERYGRSGVPLYLVSVNGAEPRVLPQLLTPEIVLDAINP